MRIPLWLYHINIGASRVEASYLDYPSWPGFWIHGLGLEPKVLHPLSALNLLFIHCSFIVHLLFIYCSFIILYIHYLFRFIHDIRCGSGGKHPVPQWQPVATCGNLWQPVATCGTGSKAANHYASCSSISLQWICLVHLCLWHEACATALSKPRWGGQS